MASEIEAEMARFEEEIGGSEGQNFDSSGRMLPGSKMPDLPPPPMFMPRNQNSSYEQKSMPPDNAPSNRHEPTGFGHLPPGPMAGPPMQNNMPDSMFGPGPMMGPGPGMMPHLNNDGRMGPGGPMNNMHGPMMRGPGQFMGGPGPMSIGPGLPPGMNPMGPTEISAPPVLTRAPKVYSSAPVIMRPPQILKRKMADSEEKTDVSIQKTTSNIANYDLTTASQMDSSPMMGSGSGMMGGMSYMSGPPPMSSMPRPRGPTKQPPPQFSQATAASAPYIHGGKGLKKKRCVRTAAGQTWEDQTLNEWDSNDYRLFCGDLGNEVTDDMLARVFNKYNSFQRARVVRDKNSKKTKGYGFVSFKDPNDFIRAMREMNGKYVGNRPIKLRKSNWKDRNVDVVKKKLKEKKKLGYKV